MAYIYNENTGEFEKTPGNPSAPGSPGQDSPPGGDWKKWLKIAGKIALPVLSVVLVAVTGVPLPHD